MNIEVKKVTRNLLTDYARSNQIFDLVCQARATKGYNGLSVNEGACVPLGLVLVGLVPVYKVSIDMMAGFQKELMVWLEDPDRGSDFPSKHGPGWVNYVYQEMMGSNSEDRLSETRVNLRTKEDVIESVGNGVLKVAILSGDTTAANRSPTTHAIFVIDVVEGQAIVTMDLIPEGRCLIAGHLLDLYEVGLVGEIDIDKLLELTEQTRETMQDFYVSRGVEYFPWARLVVEKDKVGTESG